MRRTVQIVALMLALSTSVTAGIMQCPVASPTPEPTASATQEPSVGGIMQNDVAGSLTQTALDLLALLPSLL